MPVGFPAGRSGVELRILKRLFTPEQARIALGLEYKFRNIEEIAQRMEAVGVSISDLESKLAGMADAGVVFCKKQNGESLYATMPFIVGMLEMQESRLTRDLLSDTRQYFVDGFAAAYLRAQPPQMRVIPVQRSIAASHRISSYDELKKLISEAGGRIRIGECMCRKGASIAGRQCKATTRKETCMAFRDFADMFGRTGWGRAISEEEALEIAAKNEEEGLVFQPGNEQSPQFICACCADCCGILRMAKSAPKPAEVVASNYCARIQSDLCIGCGACVDRCPMGAVALESEVASLNLDRCIGCGVCSAKCPSDAIILIKKEKEIIPPKDLDALNEAIMENKTRS
jgi:Na+-translocating ferredoxin:NAD+ oxidoreductase RNF subunit RnfB